MTGITPQNPNLASDRVCGQPNPQGAIFTTPTANPKISLALRAKCILPSITFRGGGPVIYRNSKNFARASRESALYLHKLLHRVLHGANLARPFLGVYGESVGRVKSIR